MEEYRDLDDAERFAYAPEDRPASWLEMVAAGLAGAAAVIVGASVLITVASAGAIMLGIIK